MHKQLKITMLILVTTIAISVSPYYIVIHYLYTCIYLQKLGYSVKYFALEIVCKATISKSNSNMPPYGILCTTNTCPITWYGVVLYKLVFTF